MGETVTLSTPQGQMDYKVVAVGGDVLNMKINTAYISQASMRQDFNKTEDILVQVNLAQGADAAAVEQRLKTIVENYPQFRFVATREYLEEFSKQFDAMFVRRVCLAGAAVGSVADRHPQHAGHRRHRADARDRHAAGDRRCARPGAPDDRRPRRCCWPPSARPLACWAACTWVMSWWKG